jgi:hypothetical protein
LGLEQIRLVERVMLEIGHLFSCTLSLQFAKKKVYAGERPQRSAAFSAA